MQTVQLSCIKISTISEQTKSSLHLSLFNYEYHRVCLNWFLSLWCIRRKLCTYLLPKLILSLSEPKQDSIRHTSSRSYIRYVLIDFWAYRMFHSNRASILHQDYQFLQTDQTKLSLEPLDLGVPSGASKMVFLWCIRCKPCTYLAPKLTLSLNGPKWDSVWHMSSRSSIWCVQIDFWAYGMFHANRAPILHQD